MNATRIDPLPKFSELLALYCDSQLTDEVQLARFAAQLESSEQRRREFYEYHDLHAELFWLQSASARAGLDEQALEADFNSSQLAKVSRPLGALWQRAVRVVNNTIAVSLILSAIIMASILLSLALIVPDWKPYVPPAKTPSLEFVAHITATHEATWDKSSIGNFQNVDLFEGERLVLNGGFAEVTFDDGTVVVIEAPAELIVQNRGAGFLEHGKLTATVPPPAIGFRIDTHFGTVVDLGTEFFVDATAEDKVDVGVLNGRIELELTGTEQAAGKQTLVAGESARFTAAGVQTGKLAADAAAKAPRLPEAAVESTLQAACHYRFEGNGRDSAGSGFAHGVAVGNIQYVDGVVGKGAEFRGSKGGLQRIEVPLLRTFDPGRESFSIVFWVRRSSLTGTGGYGILDALAGESIGYQVLLLDDGAVRLRLDDDDEHHVLVDSEQKLKIGDFQHVAIVVNRDQNIATYHFDGRAEPPVDISLLTGGIMPSQGLQIGAVNIVFPLYGTLDELQFFRKALAAEEINELSHGISKPIAN